MKVTLDLNNIQLTILHALLGATTAQEIAKIIRETNEDVSIMSSVGKVYGRAVAFIDNHPATAPLGEEDNTLFDTLDNAMLAMGDVFRGESK